MKTDHRNGYERIAETIIAALDQGTAPWRKPWIATGYVAQSLSTKKPYRGINQLMLSLTAEVCNYESPWWGTYKQITTLGGQVRKGEKGTYAVYFSIIEKEQEDGTIKKIPLLRGFTLFNSGQADWEEGKAPTWETPAQRTDFEVDAGAATLINRYLEDGGPTLTYGGDRAYYNIATDEVRLPHFTSFTGSGEFYSTVFHELGHSTGAEKRLNRKTLSEAGRFGDANYSREELVAEFTAAFLCGHVGVLPTTLDNSAAYIAGWRKSIADDPKIVVWAAGQAQKAADLILGINEEEEVEE